MHDLQSNSIVLLSDAITDSVFIASTTCKLVITELSLKIIHSNRLAPTGIRISCSTCIMCIYKELHLKAISCLWIPHPRRVAPLAGGTELFPAGIARADWLSSWCCCLDVNLKLTSTSGGDVSPYTVNLPLLDLILNIHLFTRSKATSLLTWFHFVQQSCPLTGRVVV